MNSDRIQTSITNIFQDDNLWTHNSRRIVFWYDPNHQFQEIFNEIELDGIAKYQLSNCLFTAKYHLLVKQPQQAFLLYAPFLEPSPADNWLLDIQKYSQIFSADL